MTAFGLSFLCAAVIGYSLNWFALIPWRKAPSNGFWTEKVNLLYPARTSRATNVWLIAGSLVCVCQIIVPAISSFVAGIGAYLGTVVGRYAMDRAIFPDLTLRTWLHLATGHLILGSLHWIIVIGFAAAMPPAFGLKTWTLFGGCLLIHVALRFGLGLRLVKMVRLFRKPTQRLSAIVDDVSRGMGISVRATWILLSANCNAAAFTTTRELAFTDKLMNTLSDEEIRAVCAHELGHLSESRLVATARFLNSLWILPFVLIRPIVCQYGWDHILALLCGVLIMRVVFKRIFRAMEVRADRIAAGQTADSSDYARALESMYRVNQMPVVLPSGSRREHPDLYDRLVAVGAKPSYPKPSPPCARSWTTWCLLIVTVAFAAMAFGE